MLGTQQFMAPEQEQDPRLATLQSDIFSLGATLHYLVTGRRPGLSRKGIPSELVEVIERATENEPDDRFVSMAAFKAALELAIAVDAPVPQPSVLKPSVPQPPVPKSAKAKSAAAVSAGPESPVSAGIRPAPRPLVAPFDADTAKAAQIAWSGFLGQSEEWTNSLGMQLRMIPPGTFQMGSPNGQGDSDEHPQHEVTLTKPFWLGIHEVTQGQWQQLMGTAPWKGKNRVTEGRCMAATHISWNDAVQFCLHLSQQESRRYRLPTEAEWEFACRAGTVSAWSFGDSDRQSFDYAWTYGNSVGLNVFGGSAQEVGRKRPNPFGLYDMHGNVWEWCQDRYDSGFYGRSLKHDPINTSGGSVVCRSGSWHDYATDARSAYRRVNDPNGTNGSVGFRIVAE
jgi:formylglycine-generating enzyme required for sulfatase activity